MREAPTVLIGDTVEFSITSADLVMTGIVLGISLQPFYGNSTFQVWTDTYGGKLVTLPLAPEVVPKNKWRLLHRPTTLEEARHRMLLARASFEKRMQEARRHGT